MYTTAESSPEGLSRDMAAGHLVSGAQQMTEYIYIYIYISNGDSSDVAK